MSAYLIFNFIYNESLKTGGSYSRKTITLTDDKDTISSFIITLFLDLNFLDYSSYKSQSVNKCWMPKDLLYK